MLNWRIFAEEEERKEIPETQKYNFVSGKNILIWQKHPFRMLLLTSPFFLIFCLFRVLWKKEPENGFVEPFSGKGKSCWRESDPWPPHYQCDALPTEPQQHLWSLARTLTILSWVFVFVNWNLILFKKSFPAAALREEPGPVRVLSLTKGACPFCPAVGRI